MKSDDYDSLRTIRELQKLKDNRKEFVIWKLSGKTKGRIEQIYEVEEYLYEIRTKTFKNVRGLQNDKLVELHFAGKNKKRSIVRQLSNEDKEVFSEYGVKYRPVKYKIYLKRA